MEDTEAAVIDTHSFPSADPAGDEARRLARLRLLAVMDTDPEPVFDRLVRIAASICGTPISLVSLVDDRRQWFKANQGLDGITETAREVAFCAHAMHGEGVMEVPDAKQDERFAHNPLVLGDPNIRFYAGAPITMPGGEHIGTLCVIDRKPRHLTEEQRRTLADLAFVARAALLQREQQHYLAVIGDETRFKAISDASPLGIFQANEAGDFFYTNGCWQEIFKLDGDRSLGRGWTQAIHPHDKAPALAAWNEAVAARTPFERQFRLLHGDSVTHVKVSGRPAAWGEPAQYGFVGIGADISTRVQAERDSQAANRFLRRAESMSGVGGWDADLRTRTVRWTEQNRRIYDLPAGFKPGFDDHLKYFDADARRQIEACAIEAIKSGKPWDIELPMTTATGRAIWVRSVGQTEYGDAGEIRLVGTLQDISVQKAAADELRESEERQKRAMDASRLALWDFEVAQGRLYLSESWSEMLGGPASPTVTTFDALAVLVPEADHAGVLAAMAAAFKGDAEHYAVEHRVRKLDGGEMWIESKGRVTRRDAQGRASRMTGTNQDITARKLAEAQIEQARAAAEASSQAKSDFLATVSHEIRTPLNGVVGMTQLLLGEELTPRQRRYAELVDASAHSLLTLINDLLDLGKIEAGRVALEDIPFDLDEVLAELSDLFTLRASEKSLLFKKSVAAGVPPWLSGDPHRLRQILSNLLTNALKFTSTGEIGLSVTVRESAGARTNLRFTVHDTGIGIPADVQSRLFNRFEQADSSTTRRFGGTGLGLAIVKHLSEMMGGGVRLSSEPGRGSAFHCDIPFAVAPVGLARQRGPADATRNGSASRPHRLLVVEDNATNQIVIQGLLAQLGFQNVVTAHNGQEAVDAAGVDRFDAILMDCHMPVMDGFDATRLLRASGCRLPIIAMTASATAADRERCLSHGMDDYLAKPLDSAKLDRLLTQWLPEAAEPAAPTFEREAALTRLGGNEQLLAMVTDAFLAQTPQGLDAARQAIENSMPDELRRHLHSLAGSSASVGAAALSAEARRLEAFAAAGDAAGAAQGLPGLARLFDSFRAAAGRPA